MFETADQLQAKVEEYFESCRAKDVPSGDIVIHIDAKQPTVTGLAFYLGFESRQSFYDYEQKPEFTYTIKRCRLQIEMLYEERLFSNANAGAIFGLKNFGWTDKQESEQKVTFKDERIDPSKLTDEELRTLAEIQRRSGTRPA